MGVNIGVNIRAALIQEELTAFFDKVFIEHTIQVSLNRKHYECHSSRRKCGISIEIYNLTKQGYATWNIEYRRVGEELEGWNSIFNDVIKAINHLSTIKES